MQTAILLIIPDNIYDDNPETPQVSHECWVSNCSINEQDHRWIKWGVGEIVWHEILKKQHYQDIDVFFLKYDRTMPEGAIWEKMGNITKITFGKMPASLQEDEHAVSFILYKTIETFRLLENKYTYFIRGNINIFLDIKRLRSYLYSFLPLRNLFTSPFLPVEQYIPGYFILLSSDVLSGILRNYDEGTIAKIRLFIQNKYNSTGPGADDVDLAVLALGKYDHESFGRSYAWELEFQTLRGGNAYRSKILQNYLGLRLEDDWQHRGHLLSTDKAIELIDQSKETTFMYRLRNFEDGGVVRVYKKLIQKLETQ